MTNDLKEILEKVFYFQNNIKLFHWETLSFAEHNAVGEFYDKFSDTSDKLVEIIFGKFGRIKLNGSISIEVSDYSQSQVDECLNEAETFFTTDIFNILKGENTEIQNISQEICGDIQQLKYLLSLS